MQIEIVVVNHETELWFEFEGLKFDTLNAIWEFGELKVIRDGITIATGRVHGARGEPVFADYDGDRKTDQAFFHKDSGQWIINYSSKPDIQEKFFLGSLGDIPIPTDINGRGAQDPTIWRPNNSTWLLTAVEKDGSKSKKVILEGVKMGFAM